MNKYQNGKIYTIRCRNDHTLIYVGSTIQTLPQRMGGHKTNSLKNPNMLLYQSIDNKWKEWYIELYELYPCNSKMELEKREGEVIRQISTLNKRIEGRTPKEYYQDNIDKKKEYYQSYYQNNKEYTLKHYQDNKKNIKEYSKQYYKDNKNTIREGRKDYEKEYREKNRDKIKEYLKQYRANKQEIAILQNSNDIIQQ